MRWPESYLPSYSGRVGGQENYFAVHYISATEHFQLSLYTCNYPPSESTLIQLISLVATCHIKPRLIVQYHDNTLRCPWERIVTKQEYVIDVGAATYGLVTGDQISHLHSSNPFFHVHCTSPMTVHPKRETKPRVAHMHKLHQRKPLAWTQNHTICVQHCSWCIHWCGPWAPAEKYSSQSIMYNNFLLGTKMKNEACVLQTRWLPLQN